MGQIELNCVLWLNWIVWNRTVYIYINGFGTNVPQWLMCHKTKLNQTKPKPYFVLWQFISFLFPYIILSAVFIFIFIVFIQFCSYYHKDFFFSFSLHYTFSHFIFILIVCILLSLTYFFFSFIIFYLHLECILILDGQFYETSNKSGIV